MKNTIFIFLIACLIAGACNNNAADQKTEDRKNGYDTELKTREDSLFHDIDEGHEFGMSKMSKLRGYLKRATNEDDSLNSKSAGEPTKSAADYMNRVADVRRELAQADSAMNSWMDAFVPDSASNNKDLRIRYLESEKEKITKVKELMTKALNDADSLWKKPSN